MKQRFRTLVIFLAAAFPAATAADYALTAVRAGRSFGFGEWAQAGALYELMLAEHPESAGTYAHAIVAAELQPDTARSATLLERAMAHGVALDSVVDGVHDVSMKCAHAEVYETFLIRMRHSMPYMARAIDARLLDYYEFRNDGEGIVRLSQSMLRGLPDSVRYLDALARGLILLGDTAGAEKALRKILALNPDRSETLILLGTMLFHNGRTDEARPLLRRAMETAPSPYLEKLIAE